MEQYTWAVNKRPNTYPNLSLKSTGNSYEINNYHLLITLPFRRPHGLHNLINRNITWQQSNMPTLNVTQLAACITLHNQTKQPNPTGQLKHADCDLSYVYRSLNKIETTLTATICTTTPTFGPSVWGSGSTHNKIERINEHINIL